MSYGQFPVKWNFLIDGGHVFGLILPLYKRVVSLSPVRLWTKFSVDTVKIQKVPINQISKKKKSWWTFMVQEAFL